MPRRATRSVPAVGSLRRAGAAGGGGRGLGCLSRDVLRGPNVIEGSASPLPLDRYLAWLVDGGVHPPVSQQIRDFAEHVSTMHSWYKHLPFDGPGAPFVFYLDRYAGLHRVATPAGWSFLALEKPACFHYSMVPTTEYRRRFGYLQVSQASSPSFEIGSAREQRSFAGAPLLWVDGGECGLPAAVAAAGTAHLRATIHPRARTEHIGDRGWENAAELARQTLAPIMPKDVLGYDRQLQMDEIIAAIDSVLSLLRIDARLRSRRVP